MTEGIFFADPELPFHVWVRERTGDEGYRWVLKQARVADPGDAGEGGAQQPDPGKAEA